MQVNIGEFNNGLHQGQSPYRGCLRIIFRFCWMLYKSDAINQSKFQEGLECEAQQCVADAELA